MGNKLMTEDDLRWAATELGCDVAAIKAVCEVEAPRGGFLPDGRVTILFERHKFHQFTRGIYDLTHPDISSPRRGGYRGGAGEWERFMRASALNPVAAQLATSWGRFQIMGFNYHYAGFPDVNAFVEAMKTNERAQLEAFVSLVKAFKLDDEMARRDWVNFAARFNGPRYRENQYDVRLTRAYQRYAKDDSDEMEDYTGVHLDDYPAPVATGPAPVQESRPTPIPVSTPNDPPLAASRDGVKAIAASVASWLFGLGGSVYATLHNNTKMLYAIAGVVIVVAVCWFVRSIVLDLERMRINSDPEKYNVK